MLKKNEFPFMDKGRWYAFHLSSDGTNHTIEDSDIIGVLSGDAVKLPEGFHITNVTYDISFIPDAAASTLAVSIKNYADGTQAFLLPAPAKYTELVAYVFGYIPPIV